MIGILGGSFDPVHFGHLRAAEESRQRLKLDKILLIPGGQPPHRDMPMASAEDRMLMLQAAVQSNPAFTVDDQELRRDGPSYTLLTLQQLQQQFPDQSLCLLLGFDAFAGIDGWHEWQQLFDYCHVAVMQRPGQRSNFTGEIRNIVERRKVDEYALQDQQCGKIVFLDVTQLDIASSRIRQLIADGFSPRYLVPDSVLELIDTKNIYRG
jgi:nicotinate-nucleotide adenylyltransferase